jgi:hypothetical protein
MLYDLMPVWLRSLLQMDKALLPADEWTWRHYCRYGSDPANIKKVPSCDIGP